MFRRNDSMLRIFILFSDSSMFESLELRICYLFVIWYLVLGILLFKDFTMVR